MKTAKLKTYVLKLLVVVCLSASIFQACGKEAYKEGYCYPADVGQIYNGDFFSYSHISMKDYESMADFYEIPGETMRLPANQKIPTFWYKIHFKDLDEYDKQLGKFQADKKILHLYPLVTIDTTYGVANSVSMFSEKENSRVFVVGGVDAQKEWHIRLIYNIDYTITVLANYNSIAFPKMSAQIMSAQIKFRCNESPYNGKLEYFRFHPDDKFRLPVRLENGQENDKPLPIFTPELLPNQGGFCSNEKKYPGFRLMWTYTNGRGIITIREPKENNNFVLANKEKELSWSTQNYNSYTNGLIDELYFANNNELSVKGGFTFPQKIERLYNKKTPPPAKDLKFTGDITKEFLYNTVPIDELRKYLTADWMLTYNHNKYNLRCTPTIELPWRAINTKTTAAPTTKDDWDIKYNSTPQKPQPEDTN